MCIYCIHVAAVARERSVICRTERRRCTKMFTEALDLVRLSTATRRDGAIFLFFSLAASNNECVLASEMPMQWEPPGACRCTQQRLSIARTQRPGLILIRDFFRVYAKYNREVAVRSPRKETLALIWFFRKRRQSNKKVAVY